jgi:hypothetical protein
LNLTVLQHQSFFSSFIHVYFPKKWEEDEFLYFRLLSAMYATAPMMQAATTAMTIASSALISGCSGTVGSGSSGVGSSGVGCSGVVGSSGVGSVGVVVPPELGCSGVIGPPAEAAGPTVMYVDAPELP